MVSSARHRRMVVISPYRGEIGQNLSRKCLRSGYHQGDWQSQTIQVAGETLDIASTRSEIALLYETAPHRLALELRDPELRLIKKQTFEATDGALGRISGERIGLATLRPLNAGAKRLTISVLSGDRIRRLASARLDPRDQVLCESAEGVVQTGKVVRLVCHGSGRPTSPLPVIFDYSELSGRAKGSVVDDPPRSLWLRRSESRDRFDRLQIDFLLELIQPVEAKLAALEGRPDR